MKLGATVQKVVAMCKPKEEENDGKLEVEDGKVPQRAGIVNLESGREPLDQRHSTYPAPIPSHQLPSHSQTAPANAADNPIMRPPMKVDIPVSPGIKRAPTVELVENKAYHPLGGPDYLKILAKYDLFGEDKNFGRVVCRFVNAGNVRNREPQIVKVEEYSAQGNQEFLAQVSIGNPPQGVSRNSAQ
jgi:hypothetical protein